MKILFVLLRSFASSLLKLSIFGLAAIVMLLSDEMPKAETANSTG
jgi:hypothetical protein